VGVLEQYLRSLYYPFGVKREWVFNIGVDQKKKNKYTIHPLVYGSALAPKINFNLAVKNLGY
jgi:hypothetical protein